MFFDIFKALCKEKGVSPTKASEEIGFSRGSVSYWRKQQKEGKEAKPDPYTAEKIADYFGVSIDYLLGRTNDPVDYDNGDTLAEIPLTYVEAANGDMKKARALMLAADYDAQREAVIAHGRECHFTAQDKMLIFALWGDTEDIDESDVEEVKRFAAFIKERKNKNDT